MIYCYSASHPERRTLHITDTVANSDNASNISTNESTLTLMLTPTRTILQESSTQSFTHITPSLDIQPTITINITGISLERQVITGVDNNNNNNNNTGMIIALLPLVMILLIIAIINLMFTIKNWKRQDQKC